MMGVMRHSSSFLLPPPEAAAQSVGQSNGPGASTNYALVVLNQGLPRFAPLLWEHAGLHLCADGGANRVYDEMPLLFPDQDPSDVRRRYRPDVIKGDMDSIRKDVKEFYFNLGSTVLDESHDQDTTDLHKCVSYINNWASQNKLNLTILVAGALGGRFDHEAGNINVLYKFVDKRIVLLSDDCLIFLLSKKHYHEIYVQPTIEGPHCGLIPVGAPSTSTTTTGLQWDLRWIRHVKWESFRQGVISTKFNHFCVDFENIAMTTVYVVGFSAETHCLTKILWRRLLECCNCYFWLIQEWRLET